MLRVSHGRTSIRLREMTWAIVRVVSVLILSPEAASVREETQGKS